MELFGQRRGDEGRTKKLQRGSGSLLTRSSSRGSRIEQKAIKKEWHSARTRSDLCSCSRPERRLVVADAGEDSRIPRWRVNREEEIEKKKNVEEKITEREKGRW